MKTLIIKRRISGGGFGSNNRKPNQQWLKPIGMCLTCHEFRSKAATAAPWWHQGPSSLCIYIGFLFSCFSCIVYVIFCYRLPTDWCTSGSSFRKEERGGGNSGLAGIFFPLTDQDCVLHNYSLLQGSWKINSFLLYSPH